MISREVSFESKERHNWHLSVTLKWNFFEAEFIFHQCQHRLGIQFTMINCACSVSQANHTNYQIQIINFLFNLF